MSRRWGWIVCCNCGRDGHMSKDCKWPLLPPQQDPEDTPSTDSDQGDQDD